MHSSKGSILDVFKKRKKEKRKKDITLTGRRQAPAMHQKKSLGQRAFNSREVEKYSPGEKKRCKHIYPIGGKGVFPTEGEKKDLPYS